MSKHKIRMNDLMTIELEIPDEISMQELDNLLSMTKKSININTITYSGASRPIGRPPTNKDRPKREGVIMHKWTEKEKKLIFKEWNKDQSAEYNSIRIAKKLKVTTRAVMGQYYTIKALKRGKK